MPHQSNIGPIVIPILSGLESPDHLNTLKSVQDECFDSPPPITVGVSYKSLRSRRLGQAYIGRLAEHFTVVIEAGVSSAPLTLDEATEWAGEYYAFVKKVPQITYAVEFSHPAAKILPNTDPRFIPLMEPGAGPEALQSLLDDRGQVAMPYDGDRALTPVLRRSTGLSVTLGEQDLGKMSEAGFGASFIQAWLYPAKYGEIIVWDGRFRRHNPSTTEERERLVGKYEKYLVSNFDPHLIQQREAREVTRAAAFAYISWGQSLSPEPSDLITPTETSEDKATVLRLASTHSLPRGVKEVRSTVPLPFFKQDEVSALEEDAEGIAEIRTRPILRTTGETVRMCSTCSLSSVCPAYKEAASCAFSIPVEVRTPAQVKAVMASLVELQAVRVGFSVLSEQARGDFDPVVGQEMDRLMRLADKVARVDERRERVSVTLESEESGGGTGVLSRIFGPRAQASVPPPAIPADVVIQALEGD